MLSAISLARASIMPSVQPDTCGVMITFASSWNGFVAGNVGSALGRGWSAIGEDLFFGVPDPADPKYGSLPQDRLRTPPEAVRTAEIVVLATPWPATSAPTRGSKT